MQRIFRRWYFVDISQQKVPKVGADPGSGNRDYPFGRISYGGSDHRSCRPRSQKGVNRKWKRQ
jgi:hypothetical protein